MRNPLHILRNAVGHRGRNIAHTGSWSLVAKGCTAANLILCIPFTLHALGPELFGAWATLVSMVAFTSFLDFGLGSGTMNLIAAVHGRGADDEIGSILRESRRTLLRIATGLGCVAIIALPLVPWTHLLGLPEEMAGSARVTVAAVLFTIVLGIPLNLAARVQLGLGRGDRAFRWQALGQMLTLALVIVLARAGASLTTLVIAAVTTPLLASAANTLSLMRDSELARKPTVDRPDLGRRIRREGGWFFVLQLAAALSFAADLPLISALRGPADAGAYAVVQRVFSIIPLSLGLVWAPLWPIYRQALAASDHRWAKRTLGRSIAAAVAYSAVGGVALALALSGPLMDRWIHQPLVFEGWLVWGFALWCVIEAAGTALATFLNAASVLRYQVATASVFGVICLLGKAWVIVHFGIEVIPWATIICYTVAAILPFAWFGRRILTEAFARNY